jgi:hypothetical protein
MEVLRKAVLGTPECLLERKFTLYPYECILPIVRPSL